MTISPPIDNLVKKVKDMEQIKENERLLEIRESYDVIVAGGGFAGVAAAVSAARLGSKVLLIEREYTLGGLGTLGLITVYEPICDGAGHQVSFSMAEELLRLSVKYGWDGEPCPAWLTEGGLLEDKIAQRFRLRFNPNVCAILLEQWLLENDVNLRYGTIVCDTIVEKNKIKALVVEGKEGRYAIACKSVVDVTGDADIARQSGSETSLFTNGNTLAAWHYAFQDKSYMLHKHGKAELPNYLKTEEQLNNPSKVKRYAGVDSADLTEMMIDMHRSVLNYYLSFGNVDEDHALATMATIPQIRMTRKYNGLYSMEREDLHKRMEDSIGMCGNWRKTNRGEIFEIPFRSLYGAKIKNLITAGRSISTSDDMWDVTRVIPVCVVTGEAAGAAAAMTDNFHDFKVTELQEILASRGVVLHETDLVS